MRRVVSRARGPAGGLYGTLKRLTTGAPLNTTHSAAAQRSPDKMPSRQVLRGSDLASDPRVPCLAAIPLTIFRRVTG
jgi:hypothetical protein